MVRILDHAKFKEIVTRSVEHKSYEEVNRLFQRYDVSDHDEARELLLAVAGASPMAGCGKNVEGPAIQDASILPMLPTWSIVDEL